ncbi:MAG TPA: NrfD/PsrC family molybdoenzyme membrane anchor subunit [Polyangia bacterium]|jgi:molybdopterin-containing oxidoreductase family membrane subunit
MIEKALAGGRRYWGLVALLGAMVAVGFVVYLRQLDQGLGITGLSRDVTWGFYISQLTFLVGVAASAVMVVLPHYLHDYKAFGKITVLGELLAVAAVTMCMLFVVVDLGQPSRALNLFRYPTPNSVLFWDATVLSGYLLLNLVISWTALAAERRGERPPRWVKPLIYLSIPWAFSIHTVTAFLYNGLSGRPFWLTAILAPRFLASAFASGPALLILLCLVLRRTTRFDAGREAIQKLAQIMTYGMVASVFFVGLELFTVFYSQIPEHIHHFQYMYLGLDGKSFLVPYMWTSNVLAVLALVLLLNPRARRREGSLAVGCVAVFVSLWIEKGLGLVVTGFIPSPQGTVTEYAPTGPELLIGLGIYALGFLILTVLYKVVVAVRESAAA